MVEITVTCDACGEVIHVADMSDRLCVVPEDDMFYEEPGMAPSYCLALGTPSPLRLGAQGWSTYMYDGREHLLCEECAMELSEMVSQFDDDRERVIKEFFGDE